MPKEDRIMVSEKRIQVVVGTAMPKVGPNQNTDDMVYGEFLNEVSFDKMAEYLFHKERFKDEEPVKSHPMNNLDYNKARILIGGPNFGTGSSREHAPQAIKRYGFDAIIAPDYAGIFDGNCAEVGLVAVSMPFREIQDLANDVTLNPRLEYRIDLENMIISGPCGYEQRISMPEPIRQSFLTGTWDTLPLLQRNQKAVDAKLRSLPYGMLRKTSE